MLKRILLASAISAAFAANPALAQQQVGVQQNNQIWLQEQTTGQGTQVYISTADVRQIQQALNQAGFDVGNVDGTWNNQTARAVADYQRSRGLPPTGVLTLSLVNSLGLQNLLTSPPQSTGGGGQQWAQEQAVGPGTPLFISPAGVRQIQQELNNRGYDVGNVDGQWDQQTAQAAAAFQSANGLEPNGKPDVNLIAALGGTQDIFQSIGQTSGSGVGTNMQWAQETAAGSPVPVWAGPATVRQVEQALNQAGYDVGNVDGQWDQQTAQSAQAFQRTNGLEPTGTLTTTLLAATGQSNWMQGQGGIGQSFGGGYSSGGQVGYDQSLGIGQQSVINQGGFGQDGFNQDALGYTSGAQGQQQQGLNQESYNQGFSQGALEGFRFGAQEGFRQGAEEGFRQGFGQGELSSGGGQGAVGYNSGAQDGVEYGNGGNQLRYNESIGGVGAQ